MDSCSLCVNTGADFAWVLGPADDIKITLPGYTQKQLYENYCISGGCGQDSDGVGDGLVVPPLHPGSFVSVSKLGAEKECFQSCGNKKEHTAANATACYKPPRRASKVNCERPTAGDFRCVWDSRNVAGSKCRARPHRTTTPSSTTRESTLSTTQPISAIAASTSENKVGV